MRGLLALVVGVVVAGCGGNRSASGNDIQVTGVGPSGSVGTGASVVFVMTVENIGGNAATDIKLVDQVGNFLAVSGITCEASGGAVCPEAPSVVTIIDAMPVGAKLVFSVTATVNATSSGTLTNTMTATLADDGNRLDNTATATVDVVVTTSNLIVGGTGPAGTATGNGPAEFVMTVRNDGPDAATTVKITEQVGSNLTLTGISCVAGGGATCPTAGVVMTLDSLPAGGTLEFHVQTTVAPGTSGTIVNTLSVVADNDRSREDNSFVATGTAYTPRSGVYAAGTGPAGAVPAGTTTTFVMQVGNAGPDPASDVTIIDTVGGNLTLQTAGMTCTATGGATCPAALGPSMSVPTLPMGGVLSFSVPAFVAVGTNGAITNTLTATPSSNDGDRSDNTAVAAGSAYANNLSVTATNPAAPVTGGASTTLTMRVANSGPGVALDVDITNTLGANLSLAGTIACTPSGGAVCPATTGPTMRAPTVPSGGGLTFSIPVTVAAGANGNLVDTLTVTAAGDSRSADNSASAVVSAVSADLGLSQEGPAGVAAGSSAVFKVLIANPGPSTASNLVIHWEATAPFPISGVTVTCVASGGATCPAVPGPDMTVASLAVGRSLTFVFTVPVPSSGRGTLVSTASVTADGDADNGNNTSSVSTVASDPLNGLYTAYAADGRIYDLTIDFDTQQYTMAGNGTSVVRAFTYNPVTGDYVVSGNERLRVATDLIVGGNAFSAGVLPYVAARKFATSLGTLGGAFNLMARNSNADGTMPVTRAGTARVSGNVLQVCQNDFTVTQAQACGAGALKSYLLSLNGDVFTGTDTVSGTSFTFRLARSGAANILLSAGPSTMGDSTLQWRIGLVESAGLAGGTTYGPGVYSNLSSDWLTIVLTQTTYAAIGGGMNDIAALSRSSSQAPVSMLQGNSSPVLGGAPIWVMQAYPLVVVTGATKAAAGTPSASGLLQIALP